MAEESIPHPARGSKLPYYLVVVTCVILCFAPSALAFSCSVIFFAPVAAYLGVPITAFAVTMTITGLAVLVALPVAGKLLEAYDARVILSAAVVLVGGGLLWRSFAQGLWEFYVSAAFIGLGVAVTLYLAAPTMIARWFRDRVGFFVGLCMAFSGVGGVVFNGIGGVLIASGPEGWRTAFLIFGLGRSLPFTLFAVRSRPADRGLAPFTSHASAPEEPSAEPVLEGVSSKRAMRTSTFYIVAAFAGLITLVSVALNYWPSYVSSFEGIYPATAGAVVWIASVCMVGTALGKIIIGSLCDRNIRYGLIFGMACGLAGLAMMWLLPGFVGCIAVGGFLFGVCFAASVVLVPLLVRYVFGSLDYTVIYARVSMVSALASAFGAIFWGLLVDGPGFNMVFIISLALVVGCLLAGLTAIRARKGLTYERAEEEVCGPVGGEEAIA